MKNRNWINGLLAIVLTVILPGCYETGDGDPTVSPDEPKDGTTDGTTDSQEPLGEWGDAPDEQDSFYGDPAADPVGHFPTAFQTVNCRIDPTLTGAHTLTTESLLLGSDASRERGSGDPLDPDGAANEVDDDGFDDGVVSLTGTGMDGYRLVVRVSNDSDVDGIGYLNVLVDLNRDGRWEGTLPDTPEWVSVNHEVLLESGVSLDIPVDFQGSGNGLESWTRIAFTSEPVTIEGDLGGWDGCGTFTDGEVEDYLLSVELSQAWDFDFDVWSDYAKDVAHDWAEATDAIHGFAQDEEDELARVGVEVSAHVKVTAEAVSEALAYAAVAAESVAAAESSVVTAVEAQATAESHAAAAAVSAAEAAQYAAAMSVAVAQSPCATAVASAEAQASALVVASAAAATSASASATATAGAVASAQAFALSAASAHAEALAAAGSAATSESEAGAKALAFAEAHAKAKAMVAAVGIAHAEAEASAKATSDAYADAMAASDALAEAVSLHGWTSVQTSAAADAWAYAIAKAFATASATADAWIDGWAVALTVAEARTKALALAMAVAEAKAKASGFALSAGSFSAKATMAAGAAGDSAALTGQFVTAAFESMGAASAITASAASASSTAAAFTDPSCKKKVCAELTSGCYDSLDTCEGDRDECIQDKSQCESALTGCQMELDGWAMEFEMLHSQVQGYQAALQCAVEVAPQIMELCPIPSSFLYGK